MISPMFAWIGLTSAASAVYAALGALRIADGEGAGWFYIAIAVLWWISTLLFTSLVYGEGRLRELRDERRRYLAGEMERLR